jgi:ligand-binding sensor domain-containing protein
MSRPLLAGFVGAAMLAAPLPALAQRAVTLSFPQLGLGTLPTRVGALASDRTNQVWVGTDQGVSGVQGGERAPFFPFRANDGLLANDVRAVTFGQLGTDEHFFLGFSSGIQYGRLLSTSGLSLAGSLLAGATQDARNLVNDLASDGAQRVWAATAGGLVEWDITSQTPTLGTTFLASAAPFLRVAVAPWAGDRAAVAAAGRELFLVRTTSPIAPASFFTANSAVADLAFDPAGNLWALSAGRDVIRFNAAFGGASGPGSFPSRSDFRIDASLRDMRALAIDPFTGTVWVGTDQGAYFQEPQGGTLASRVCGTGDAPGVGCWALDTTPNFTQTDRVDRIYADPSGNTWFGTNRGLRGRIVRLLSLNSSTYLGGAAQAVISLEDLPGFAGNGQTDTATVELSVGTASTTLEAGEEGDTGRFTFTVRLADVADVPGSDGVDVSVAYAFLDPDQQERTLVARARWANIVSFEDDLWIGGPCFLEALRR